MGGRVPPRHFLESVIAEIGAELLVIVLRELDQPQNVIVAVDAEQHLLRVARAIRKPGQDAIAPSQKRALETVLYFRKRHHSAAHSLVSFLPARTFAAIARARSSSATTSASGGILASRSIMVETGPKRSTAAA